MAELTVAVVGCGDIGGVHLACWSNLTGVRIAAVCDADGGRVARTAADYAGVAAFVTVNALLAAGPFDIVDVCTPPTEHFAAASAALNAGCNVLCDKPLAATPDDARALVRLADARERLLLTAFPHRFHPPILFAKELLDNDDMGSLTMFRCRFSGRWDEAEASELADAQTSGGGALLNTAIHGIDLFRHFCGEVRDVSGHVATTNPDLGVEDTAAVLLRSERGALGVVEASWSSPGGRNVVELYGTAGAVIVDYDTQTLRYQTADQPFWQSRDEGGPNRYERLIAHAADAVRGLQPPEVTDEDGARAVEICHAVYSQSSP